MHYEGRAGFFRLIDAYGYPSITHAIYAYKPLTLRALGYIMEYEISGSEARFRAFVGDLVRVIAGGRQIELDSVPAFSSEIEKAYASPWNNHAHDDEKVETGEDIVRKLLGG